MMISTESLAALNATLLMSSREIARITGITHGEVKRLIKSLETAQRLYQPVTVNHYEHEGETRQEFQLNKRDSLLAVARLSPCFTAGPLAGAGKIHPSARFHQSGGSGTAWAEQFDQRRAAEQQLALTASKAEFFDRFVDVHESLGFRQLCKMLKVKEPEFRQFLLERNIMYRDKGALTPQQHHLQAGYFALRSGMGENQHAFSQARFTAKGVKWVASLWAGHVAARPNGVAA
ncbi:KilA protein [Plautia stali symbiont]|nr:KilA protein [Plautia stali symbiont]